MCGQEQWGEREGRNPEDTESGSLLAALAPVPVPTLNSRMWLRAQSPRSHGLDLRARTWGSSSPAPCSRALYQLPSSRSTQHGGKRSTGLASRCSDHWPYLQDWADHHPTPGTDHGRVPRLPVWEARAGHTDGHEFLCGGLAGGKLAGEGRQAQPAYSWARSWPTQAHPHPIPCGHWTPHAPSLYHPLTQRPMGIAGLSCQRGGARAPRLPRVHVHWLGHHLRAGGPRGGPGRIHHSDPHPHHAQWRWVTSLPTAPCSPLPSHPTRTLQDPCIFP